MTTVECGGGWTGEQQKERPLRAIEMVLLTMAATSTGDEEEDDGLSPLVFAATHPSPPGRRRKDLARGEGEGRDRGWSL